MRCIRFDKEKKYVEDFLSLPKRLYAADRNMEDPKQTKQLLLGTHPLSKYFTLDKFLVYDGETAVGRFAVTTYPQDDTAYLGFYECVHNDRAAKFLFDTAYSFAKSRGCSRLVGPVDASFWIKYRLKTNFFNIPPYTGEPYNQSWYLKQFTDNGFSVWHHYTSNMYRPIEADYANEKYSDRLQKFLQEGYEIISPDMKDYAQIIDELYGLLTELYKDFPTYKPIEKADFVSMFSSYKTIMLPQMVKLAYYKGKMVGFFLSVPNFGNAVYHLNPLNILKILRTKADPQEYVMLYMGVDQAHKGLGKALAGSIMDALRGTGLPSIGALARDGKVTQNYGDDLIEGKYEYVLLERAVEG
ncbi:MAG: hypothetical protein ACI4I5_00310 [Acutalibacteraceae bacterium]